MIRIIHAQTDAHFQTARKLFLQYADSLGFDLEFQGFSRELAGLPGDYASPGGCILLAVASAEYTGCVALRPWQDKICEMKRLYVIPAYQGRGIGRELANAVIGEAREKGYQKMRLDTIQSMKAAQELYISLGFEAIDAYCYNPLDKPTFMELELFGTLKNKFRNMGK
jgi:ribosomal protein S18 acetylase RimI-like enzyme